MAIMTNILIDQNNNCLLYKNRMKYIKAKIIQARKMSKRLMDIFFNNPNLASI